MADKDSKTTAPASSNPLKNVHTSSPATENRNFQLNTQKQTSKSPK